MFNIIYWSSYKGPNKKKSKRKKPLASVDVNSGAVRAGLCLEDLEQGLQDMCQWCSSCQWNAEAHSNQSFLKKKKDLKHICDYFPKSKVTQPPA